MERELVVSSETLRDNELLQRLVILSLFGPALRSKYR